MQYVLCKDVKWKWNMKKRKSELWKKMWQRSRWEWDKAPDVYFVFSAFGWKFCFFCFAKKRCRGEPLPYFSLNFWMGEFCLLFLPLKKMRRRSSWEREGASTGLQLASVWRALPVVVVVVDYSLKFLCTWIIVKNSLTFVEKTWQQNDNTNWHIKILFMQFLSH